MAVVRTPPIRLGYKVADTVIERDIKGRTLDERDYNVVLNPAGGPLMVYMPDGKPLCCYLPGILTGIMEEIDAYKLLHPLHAAMTNNRGLASGTKRITRGETAGARSDAMSVSSPILGTFEPAGIYRYCRMTEWTGSHLPEWESLAPMFRVIASHFEERVTERYNVQMDYVRKTDPGWIVPGTPFTTITVNNSYPTGVHKDDGDLVEGFSSIACIRRGDYDGGVLVFPQYRVGVDLQDGDLLLMDAHQWHGNTRMTCACGERILNKLCSYCGAERISIVSYYRTKMAECGSPDDELQRAIENTEKRSQPKAAEVLPEKESEGASIATAEPEAAAEAEAEVTKVAVPDLVKPAVPTDSKSVRRRKAAVQKRPEPEPEPETATAPEPEAEAETEAPVTAEVKKPVRRARKKVTTPVVAKIAVDPATGEPLEV